MVKFLAVVHADAPEALQQAEKDIQAMEMELNAPQCVKEVRIPWGAGKARINRYYPDFYNG